MRARRILTGTLNNLDKCLLARLPLNELAQMTALVLGPFTELMFVLAVLLVGTGPCFTTVTRLKLVGTLLK